MRESTFKLLNAYTRVKLLLAVGGDPQPVAAVLGRALGWKWPEGMDEYDAQRLARLCDLLNVNLPGRPQGVR